MGSDCPEMEVPVDVCRPHAKARTRWLLILIVVVAACGPTMDTLADEAEAQLELPVSVELAAGGTDAEKTPEGPLAAIAWRSYGVDATFEEVVAYFDAELASRGWEEREADRAA